MWTWNSSKLLPMVLPRITQVVPKEVTGQRIIIDDHSEDDTVEVARKYGWTVHQNRGKGLKHAVITALSYVETEYFLSFEHDILLSRNWWTRISRYIKDKSVAVAQGVRVATDKYVRKLDEYILERGRIKSMVAGVSIDNNLYQTRVIRRFKYVARHLLYHLKCAEILARHGYKWLVDHSVVSKHIRGSVRLFLKHSYVMTMKLSRKPRNVILKSWLRLLWSPFRGLHIAWRKRCVGMIPLYSANRFAILAGMVHSMKNPFYEPVAS
jgi:glycosyltransferase involved in cell wall biosynthesis